MSCSSLVGTVEDRDILVAPPFTALASVAQRVAGSRIQVSGQDVYWEDKGAYTGEISGPMLRRCGVLACDRRALGTPPVLRRHRRMGGPKGRSRVAG